MSLHEEENIVLAKWLSGELSDEELKLQVSEEQFKTLTGIVRHADRLQLPALDLENSYQQQQKVNKAATAPSGQRTTTKVISLKNRFVQLAVAASVGILILVGIQFYQDPIDSMMQCKPGYSKTFTLPGGSAVHLNGGSKITFNRENWSNERKVNLEGEGFFEVEKGSEFIVSTTGGEVKVLGTKFNALSRKGSLRVGCYEGSVEVTVAKNKAILEPGDAVYVTSNGELKKLRLKGKEPSWKNGITDLPNASLSEIFSAYEAQFGIEVDASQIDATRMVDAFFFHDDQEEALKQICEPMDLNYSINEEKVILTNK